jgi:hypothetical protein
MQNKEIQVPLQPNLTKTMVLEEGGIELDGVEIVREMPVSIKEIPLFTMQIRLKRVPEKVRCFKRLPGVEVT